MLYVHLKPFVCLGEEDNIDGLAQDCSNSSALAMELLQPRANLDMNT